MFGVSRDYFQCPGGNKYVHRFKLRRLQVCTEKKLFIKYTSFRIFLPNVQSTNIHSALRLKKTRNGHKHDTNKISFCAVLS